jgi:hypothetical protein
MKDLVKSILKVINNVNGTIDINKDDNKVLNFIYDKNEMDYLLEQCKLLEYALDNQHFSNLVSDLEDNMEYNIDSIYTYNILNSIKKYFTNNYLKKQLFII